MPVTLPFSDDRAFTSSTPSSSGRAPLAPSTLNPPASSLIEAMDPAGPSTMSSTLRWPSVRLGTVDQPGGSEMESRPPPLECISEYVVATLPRGATSTMVPWAVLALFLKLDPKAQKTAAKQTATTGTMIQPSPGRRSPLAASQTPGPATAT